MISVTMIDLSSMDQAILLVTLTYIIYAVKNLPLSRF